MVTCPQAHDNQFESKTVHTIPYYQNKNIFAGSIYTLVCIL